MIIKDTVHGRKKMLKITISLIINKNHKNHLNSLLNPLKLIRIKCMNIKVILRISKFHLL